MTYRRLSTTLLASCALGLSACGSGSPSDTATTSASSQPASSSATARAHHDSGGGSKQLETKGGDNSIQEYGSEPASGEFEEAAGVLHEYLDARAAGAWGAACKRLAPSVAQGLVRQLRAAAGTQHPGCAAILAQLTAAVPPSALREAAIADVAALRAEGDSGFLLFKGRAGERFFIPMQRQDGHWKVAAVAASPLD